MRRWQLVPAIICSCCSSVPSICFFRNNLPYLKHQAVHEAGGSNVQWVGLGVGIKGLQMQLQLPGSTSLVNATRTCCKTIKDRRPWDRAMLLTIYHNLYSNHPPALFESAEAATVGAAPTQQGWCCTNPGWQLSEVAFRYDASVSISPFGWWFSSCI